MITVVGTIGLFAVGLSNSSANEWPEPDTAGYLAEVESANGMPTDNSALDDQLTKVGFQVCERSPEVAHDQLAADGLSDGQVKTIIDAAHGHLCP